MIYGEGHDVHEESYLMHYLSIYVQNQTSFRTV
jgi:hypothetical protein